MNETAESDSDESESDCSTIGDGPAMSDPSYASRVEFALRLGYTELQVRKALAKLGPNPAQNELLAELIRLDSLPGSSQANSSSSGVGVAAGDIYTTSYSNDPAALQRPAHRPLSLTNSSDSLRHVVIDGSNVALR